MNDDEMMLEPQDTPLALEFQVRIDSGDVFINNEFVSQLCWTTDSVGYAVMDWLNRFVVNSNK